MDLNKLMDRRIHKNILSIFGMRDSWRIGRAIHMEFSSNHFQIMSDDKLKKNLTITYQYSYKGNIK